MEQLLSTKFYIPPTRLKLVSRPRLVDQINHGLHRKLTLISTPAGFGKTTLISEWIEQSQSRTSANDQDKYEVAWLSLDESDNDPIQFWTYFVSSLRRVKERKTKLGDGALSMLQSSQPPPIETILTVLINDLAANPDKILLVLDDYHLITASPVDDALTFFVEHLPPQLHLIISTRSDPQLPLAQLRAKDQMTELRAAELQFTTSETAEFLNRAMGLDLSEEDIAALEVRTEGWIAGLQLAAISMQGNEDVSTFIKAFTGSNRLVLDYLIEEVLNKQPENIQNFLMQTAILDRLTGPLCDAVTGGGNSDKLLEALDRANIFIVPVDDERRWYRYHQLFADLLQLRMKKNRAEQLPSLHSRASEWYQIQGDTDRAFRHALEAGDSERGANIIEPICMTMITDSRISKLGDWLSKLPEEQIAARPWLCVSGAWANLFRGQSGSVEKLLSFTDSFLSDSTPETLPDRDQIHGHTTTIRAFIARWQEGDFERSIELSQEASEYVPEDNKTVRSVLTLNQGIANLVIGNIAAAVSALDEAITVAQEGKNHYAALAAHYNLGQAQVKQGYLHQAARTYRQALQLGTKWGGGQPLPASGFAHVGLSQVLYEWNELDEALINLTRGIKLAELVNEISVILDGTFTLSQLKLAQGELPAAAEALERAQAILSTSTRAQVTSRLLAQQAQLWLAQGNLAVTLHWAKERETFLDDEVQYASMPEYLALARVLSAQGEMDKASQLLVKLRKDADLNDRKRDLIEILALTALLSQTQGDIDQAAATLEKALALAEPEGFCRIFVDEGPPMAKLLNKIQEYGIFPDYVSRLLNAFSDLEPKQTTQVKTYDPNAELIEPLTERELEVLQLIAEGLTNKEVALKLYISLNTIKAHLRNIFGKLDVNNRIQAVGKAKALGILPLD